MIGKKIKLSKNFSNQYKKDINLTKKFQLFSPEIRTKVNVKKIILDC